MPNFDSFSLDQSLQKTAEKALSDGFSSIKDKLGLDSAIFDRDGGNVIANFIGKVVQNVASGTEGSLATWAVGLSEEAINPAAGLFTATLAAAQDLIFGDTGNNDFDVGDYCMVKEGYKQIKERELDWAESAMFEDAGDNELLEKTVPDYHVGLIEEIEKDKVVYFDFVSGETRVTSKELLKHPNNIQALNQDGILGKLRSEFKSAIFGEKKAEASWSIGDECVFEGDLCTVATAPRHGEIYLKSSDGTEIKTSIMNLKPAYQNSTSRELHNNHHVNELVFYDEGPESTICIILAIQGADCTIRVLTSTLEFRVKASELLSISATYKKSLLGHPDVQYFVDQSRSGNNPAAITNESTAYDMLKRRRAPPQAKRVDEGVITRLPTPEEQNAPQPEAEFSGFTYEDGVPAKKQTNTLPILFGALAVCGLGGVIFFSQ